MAELHLPSTLAPLFAGLHRTPPLKALGSGNVREAPGTMAPVAFAVESGDSLTGYSYVEDWVRISDEMGRGGWIFRKLIARR